jgi:hypothetical protein
MSIPGVPGVADPLTVQSERSVGPKNGAVYNPQLNEEVGSEIANACEAKRKLDVSRNLMARGISYSMPQESPGV